MTVVPNRSSAHPCRRRLPHEVPSWVGPEAKHFITVNCRERGVNQLCRDSIAEGVLQSVRTYEQLGRWYVWQMVVMPDHLHLIATFDRGRGIQSVMAAWKGYHAKANGIRWQSGFFEHRLRTDDEFVEKAAYVRMNPVRNGLVTVPELWPHVLDRTGLEK